MKIQPAIHKAAIAGMLLFSVLTALGAPAPGAPETSLVSAQAKQVLDRAELLRNKGRSAEAEQELSTFAALHGRETPKHLIARIHNDLGTLCMDQRRFSEAYLYFKQSIAEWESAGAQFRLHGSSTMNNLATALWADGRLSEAQKTLARSAAIQVEVAGPLSPSLTQVYYNQGILSMALKNFVEAEEAYVRFLSVPSPREDYDYLLQQAVVVSNLGLIYRHDARARTAGTHFEHSRRIWAQWRQESGTRPEPSRVDTVLLLNVAESFWKAGSISEAAAACETVLSALESGRDAARPRLVSALNLHAQILRKMKRRADSRAALQRAKQLLHSSEMPPAPTQHRIDALTLKSLTANRHDLRR